MQLETFKFKYAGEAGRFHGKKKIESGVRELKSSL